MKKKLLLFLFLNGTPFFGSKFRWERIGHLSDVNLSTKNRSNFSPPGCGERRERERKKELPEADWALLIKVRFYPPRSLAMKRDVKRERERTQVGPVQRWPLTFPRKISSNSISMVSHWFVFNQTLLVQYTHLHSHVRPCEGVEARVMDVYVLIRWSSLALIFVVGMAENCDQTNYIIRLLCHSWVVHFGDR